jgi:hypothetical protein
MVITLIYLAILVICALSIAARHGPILLRGRRILWFNGIVLGLQLLIRPPPILLWLLVFAVIFAVSWLGVRTWFVFKEDPLALARVIETRLRRVLADFDRNGDAYRIQFGGGPASIARRRLLPGVETLTFYGDWRQNKAKVARRFLAKYFEPVIPRPRFRV